MFFYFLKPLSQQQEAKTQDPLLTYHLYKGFAKEQKDVSLPRCLPIEPPPKDVSHPVGLREEWVLICKKSSAQRRRDFLLFFHLL